MPPLFSIGMHPHPPDGDGLSRFPVNGPPLPPPDALGSQLPLQHPTPHPLQMMFDNKLKASVALKWDGALDGYALIKWVAQCRAVEVYGGWVPLQLAQMVAHNFDGPVQDQWLMLPPDQQIHWTQSFDLHVYWSINVYLGKQFLTKQHLLYFEMQYHQEGFWDENPLDFIYRILQWYRVFINSMATGSAAKRQY